MMENIFGKSLFEEYFEFLCWPMSYIVDSSLFIHNPCVWVGKPSFSWKEWVQKGTAVLCDLYTEQDLKSFKNLQAEFKLQKQQYCQYVQIHLIKSIFKTPLVPQNAKTPSFIISSYVRGQEVLLRYSALLQKYSNISSQTNVWETDFRNCLYTKRMGWHPRQFKVHVRW